MRLTPRFERLLPAEFQVERDRNSLDDLAPRYLQPGPLIHDVGGGKHPMIGLQLKSDQGLRTVGLGIDDAELAAAPPGLYDQTICADIAAYAGRADGDLVVCQYLLGHVRDTDRAIGAIASILKPGGPALIYVPCRNAVFARMNSILPEGIKRRILFGLFLNTRKDHGFPAYYNRYTPAGFDHLGRRHGLIRESRRLYFASGCFQFCLAAVCGMAHVASAVPVDRRGGRGRTFAVVFRKDR